MFQDREFGTDSWLTSILVSVKYMVHATKGIVVREGDISSHGSASSSRVGGDQSTEQGLPVVVGGAPPLLPQYWQTLHTLLQTLLERERETEREVLRGEMV